MGKVRYLALTGYTVLSCLAVLGAVWAVFAGADPRAEDVAEPKLVPALSLQQIPPEPGPEVDGLRLMLTVDYDGSDGVARHRFRLDVLNTGPEEVTLVGSPSKKPRAFETILRDGAWFSTGPQIIFFGPQTGVPGPLPAETPVPSQTIAAGGSFGAEWDAEPYHLRPNGPHYPFYYDIPTPGLFLVRARKAVATSDGRRVELVSNPQRFFAGGTDARPKPPVAHVVDSDEASRTATLDVGTASGAGTGDLYMVPRTLGCEYILEIVDVGETWSTARVTMPLRIQDSWDRVFPMAQDNARLMSEKEKARFRDRRVPGADTGAR